MRRVFLATCLVSMAAVFSAIPGGAQEITCTDPDLMALVFDNNDINYTSGPGPVSATLYIMNPSVMCDCVSGWEVKLVLPTNLLFMNATLMGNAINLAT
ncbi:MAG: hypothetical protein ABIF77_04640, partial [bacterium]